MNSATIEYKQQVWQFLEKMQLGKRYTIAKLAKPDSREKFVATIKEYMDSLPYQGGLNFNYDYTKIYKTRIPDTGYVLTTGGFYPPTLVRGTKKIKQGEQLKK